MNGDGPELDLLGRCGALIHDDVFSPQPPVPFAVR